MRRGVLVTILVLVIIVILVALAAGYIYLQFTREPYIAENSFLRINLIGDIVDNDISLFSRKYSIRNLWYHIQRAKIDRRIRGIILKISYMQTGLARVEDIGRMIKDFRKSGKKVYAFIENGGLKEYFLATFADRVYAFKGGNLFLNGLAAETIFLKDTLSRLGIKAEFFHIGEYKTASNTFTEDQMTPAHRESLQTLLDDIFEATIEKISLNRSISKEVVRKEIEAFPFSNQGYLGSRLIDRQVYEDEILDDSETEYQVVDFNTYKETISPLPYAGHSKIAVIFAGGEIRPGSSGDNALFGGEVMGAETLAAELRLVRKASPVKAVVLRINSPGGSPFAADVIRREIELVAEKKPLVISMSDVAASGAYQFSLSASKIMALPQTITGSIGVFGGKFVLKDLYDKIGVKKATVKTSRHADIFSDYREFSPEEKQKYIGFMRQIYDSFLEIVARSRNMKIEEVEKIARGRVWAGKSAVKLHLVDQTGGLLDAIEVAKKLAKIPPQEGVGIRIFPREKTFWDVLHEYIGVKAVNPISINNIEAQLRSYIKIFPALLMPYRIQID